MKNGSFYRLTRDLHLYLGLFISPFVLVFCISVFFLVHSWIPRFAPENVRTRVVPNVALPGEWKQLAGRPLVEALKPTLEKLNVPGEIGFVRHLVKEQRLVIPVSIPGRATTVNLNLATQEATVTTRETGIADAMVMLHRAPGPHGPEVRGNWIFMKAWRWFADATVYLLLFITVSGVYLWYVLRAERRVGIILLAAGTVAFFGIAYVISH